MHPKLICLETVGFVWILRLLGVLRMGVSTLLDLLTVCAWVCTVVVTTCENPIRFSGTLKKFEILTCRRLGKVECSRVWNAAWWHRSVRIERSWHWRHEVVTVVRSWHALHLHRIWSAWHRSLTLANIWRWGTCWWCPGRFWKRTNSKLQTFARIRKFTMVTWEYWHGAGCLSRAFGCQILQ